LDSSQRQEARDQRLAAADGLVHDGSHVTQVTLARIWIVKSIFDLRPHNRERRAQLVGGIRDEAALTRKRLVEAIEHRVERVGELSQLVGGALERDPLTKIALGCDPPRRRRYPGHRP
jgi:hypothetical protein